MKLLSSTSANLSLCFVVAQLISSVAGTFPEHDDYDVLPPFHGPHRPHHKTPKCRFAPSYTSQQISRNPDNFIHDLLYWEGHFASQPGISYHAANAMTYDGTLLDWTTGLAFPSGRHNFSAASKESLHVMLLAHALAGSYSAALVVAPEKPWTAQSIAFDLMKTKLETYLEFNRTYPGFGGFLPWYNNTYAKLEPTWDWVDRVPGLDNGELFWAVYGAVEVLQTSHKRSYRTLGERWQEWLDYTQANAAKMFYHGNGQVCAVVSLHQNLTVNDPGQNYTCEGDDRLDDPYEGELFTWWLYFSSSDLSAQDREALWIAKRAKLQSVEYHKNNIGPITVQRAYWGSAHEQWKVLEMPYYDVEIVKQVYTNFERVRTCNSAATKNPGLYASVSNITNVTTGDVEGYISNAGIPSVSFIKDQELDIVTPYGVFPTLMVLGKTGREVGMVWWWNMVVGKKMQNPYGSTESERKDGTGVASLVTWDSKITTVVALLGGVGDFVREKMKRDGIYDDFIRVTSREYNRVFTSLKGENVALCLPTSHVPDAGLEDYTHCSLS